MWKMGHKLTGNKNGRYNDFKYYKCTINNKIYSNFLNKENCLEFVNDIFNLIGVKLATSNVRILSEYCLGSRYDRAIKAYENYSKKLGYPADIFYKCDKDGNKIDVQ